MPLTDLAIPFFGYKSHISIDRKFRLIRKWKTTNATSQTYAPAYPEIQCRKVRDPISCGARLCEPEITDRVVRPNRRHHPSHHEDRAGQYRLQHAPLPLLRKVER